MTPLSRRLSRTLRSVSDAAIAGLFVVTVVPLLILPLDRAVALAGMAGRIFLPLLPVRRRIERNLALVWPDFGPEHTRTLIAGVGDSFARTIAEYVRLPALAAMPERRRTEGLGHLTDAVAAGRGAVIASAHFGNWEMIRLAARDAGVDVGIIYRAFNNRSFDRLAMLRIRVAGEPVLHKGRQGLRDMLGLVRDGGVILVLMDQHVTTGAPLPFLGRPALTATAIPAMCKRVGAALLPATATRSDDGKTFDIRFEAPVAPGDAEEMTAEVNRRMEAWVRARPAQWFWLHRRWRPS